MFKIGDIIKLRNEIANMEDWHFTGTVVDVYPREDEVLVSWHNTEYAFPISEPIGTLQHDFEANDILKCML